MKAHGCCSVAQSSLTVCDPAAVCQVSLSFTTTLETINAYRKLLIPKIYLLKLNYVNSLVLVTLAAAAKSLQSCPTPFDPIDGSPPGSPVPAILQARSLEWVAISFSNAWKWKVKVKSLNHVRLLETPWTAAYQAPLSMGFSRKEYWSGFVTLKTSVSKSTVPALGKDIAWGFRQAWWETDKLQPTYFHLI